MLKEGIETNSNQLKKLILWSLFSLNELILCSRLLASKVVLCICNSSSARHTLLGYLQPGDFDFLISIVLGVLSAY